MRALVKGKSITGKAIKVKIKSFLLMINRLQVKNKIKLRALTKGKSITDKNSEGKT